MVRPSRRSAQSPLLPSERSGARVLRPGSCLLVILLGSFAELICVASRVVLGEPSAATTLAAGTVLYLRLETPVSTKTSHLRDAVTRRVATLRLVTRPAPLSEGLTATGASWKTDGRLLAIELKAQ